MRGQERQNRTYASRGQRGENRERVNKVLVEYAQNYIHRDQRRQDKNRLVRKRILICLGGPLKAGSDIRRKADLPLRCLDHGYRLAQRYSNRKIERESDRRKLPLVVH